MMCTLNCISAAAYFLISGRRLCKLLRILVPGFFTPEVGHCAGCSPHLPETQDVFVLQMGYLLLVALMLVLRTYADVWMIQNGTSIEG